MSEGRLFQDYFSSSGVEAFASQYIPTDDELLEPEQAGASQR